MPKIEQSTARSAAANVALNLEKLTLPKVDRLAVQATIKAASEHMHAMLSGIANTFSRMVAASTKQPQESKPAASTNGQQAATSSLRASFLKTLG